ncbi:MAG: hypothetical protein PVS3B3_12620 [Ktedonobacteraceae bacterium]
MSTTLTPKQTIPTEQLNIKNAISEKLLSLLTTWELYPILFVTAFLRFYHINTTTFVDDDAVVFRLAHDVFAHGLLPLTSNMASLGNLNPPMVVYLFMLPAAISANPLWAEVMVGLLNTIAVLLTYFFTRRYYGRFAGITAAILFATAVRAVIYSRNIWPQNLLPFFTMLFLFMLFRGVVERRKGWFVPAVFLLCILYQLHGSGLFLLVPFAVAVLFAYRTIRWYDIVLSAGVVFVLFSPYLYWEYLSHWSDIRILLSASKHPAHIDTAAIDYYKHALSPYVNALDINDHDASWPTYPTSIFVQGKLRYLKLPMFLELELMWLLLHCSIAFAFLVTLIPQRKKQSVQEEHAQRSFGLLIWWKDLCASPFRQGVLLLLCWQSVLLTLTRHTIDLFPHYVIIFLPGQFILIALFLSKGIEFVQHYRPDFTRVVRYGSYLLVVLVVAVQLLGSGGALLDNLHGRFNPQWYPGFNDLGSIQNALTRADQLAQERHIHRIYVPTILTTTNATRLLAEQLKTPVTTFDAQRCTVLPDPAVGPVVFLNDARDGLIDSLLKRYSSATLIAQLPHLANPPFNLYIVTTNATTMTMPRSFTSDLQLLDQKAIVAPVPYTHQQMVLTRWHISKSAIPAPFTTYNFNFKVQYGVSRQENFFCGNSALWSGDQMLIYSSPMNKNALPMSIRIRAASFTSSPKNYALGPLTLTTYNILDTPWKVLTTVDGKDTITIPSSVVSSNVANTM